MVSPPRKPSFFVSEHAIFALAVIGGGCVGVLCIACYAYLKAHGVIFEAESQGPSIQAQTHIASTDPLLKGALAPPADAKILSQLPALDAATRAMTGATDPTIATDPTGAKPTDTPPILLARNTTKKPTTGQSPKAGEAPKSGEAATPADSSLAGAAGAGVNMTALEIAGKLKQVGAGTCAPAINAGAVSSMVGVTQSNTASLWSNIEPRDKHLATVLIGQRYGNNDAVPYGATAIIASPNASGSCDTTVVQVVSSPLPCGNVRENLTRQGKYLGDLAGLPLIQSQGGQVLLLPTATNACVLIDLRAKFQK